MDLLEVGKIVNTHGLRGEVKVVPWTDYPENFEDIEYVYARTKEGDIRLDITGIKYQKNNVILKFEQIPDIDKAQMYKNVVLLAQRDMFDLPEGVYFIADLIGLSVYNIETNELIGKICDVFNTGSSDIYDVKREGKKNLLIPVIDDVVKEIDMENRRVLVFMMEGLDDEV